MCQVGQEYFINPTGHFLLCYILLHNLYNHIASTVLLTTSLIILAQGILLHISYADQDSGLPWQAFNERFEVTLLISISCANVLLLCPPQVASTVYHCICLESCSPARIVYQLEMKGNKYFCNHWRMLLLDGGYWALILEAVLGTSTPYPRITFILFVLLVLFLHTSTC